MGEIRDLMAKVEKAHFESAKTNLDESIDSIMKSLEKISLARDLLRKTRTLLHWHPIYSFQNPESNPKNMNNDGMVSYIFKM